MKLLIKYRLFFRLWSCLLIALLLTVGASQGQTFNFKPRDLSVSTTATQIKQHNGFADTLTVRQDRWDEMRQNWTTWGTKIKFKSIHDFVRFYVDYGYSKKVSDPYTLRLAYKVLGFGNMADTTAFTTTYDTLTISYKADSLATFQDMQYKKYSGYNKMMVIMTGLYKITGAGALPQPVDMSSGSSFSQLNFGVEAAISVQPFHKMVDPGTGFVSVYGEASTTVNMLATPVNDNLQLNWNLPGGSIPGNLELTPGKYELEWTYIDNYKSTADGTLSTIAASNLNYNFKNNATRVWVDTNYYQLPLIYQQGYLVYRVRIVRPDSINFEYPVYGPWNVADNGNVGSLAAQYKYQIGTSHLSDSLNWQYTVSFAEQGKYKQVMSYYDGMLKNRQSITRFNSMPNKLIATEQIYDFEGRPSISILPTPINTYGFRYQFNVSTNFATNKPYRAGDFDTLSLSICPFETPPSKLAIGAAASQYYSPSNPDQAGYQQFVPDAKGYPFVQTLFSPGYTDRVDKQGGAGDTLQIGFGHNVKNNYVSADQMDLNRLFGLDIGWAGFYRKTVSKDPNGQYSLNVTDYHGKTVASSMIGIPDTSTHAIVMNTNVPDTTMYSEDYIAGTAQNIIGNKRILDKSIFNDVAGNNIAQYIYAYAPYPTFCPGKYLTVKAKYNYALTDECGMPVTSDSGVLGTTGVTTSGATDTSNGTVHSFYAQQGQEDLHKELTVNLTDVYAAVDSFMALDHTQNCLRTEPDFIKQEVLARQYPCPEDLEHMQCPSCGSKEYEMIQELWPNKDSTYAKRKYGIYRETAGMVIGNDNSIFTLLCHHGNSSTNVIVDSGNIRNVIHSDGSVTGFPNETGIYTVGTNGINNANVFAVSGTDTMHCHYRYQDTCLVHLPTSVVKLGETYTHLQTLPVDTFIYLFSDSIAMTLLPLHPEYCHLLDCVDDAFADKLNSIPDAGVADALGLLTVSDMISHDPLFTQLNAVPGLYPNAFDTLAYSSSGHVSLDTIALIQAYCNCSDTAMLNECRTHMFAQAISSDNLENDFVKQHYFTTARGIYLANRMRYLGNLNPATSLYGNCATCQPVRMTLVPMPVFTGVFVNPNGGSGSSGGSSGSLATDTGSFIWAVNAIDTAGADSLSAFAQMLQNAIYPSTAYNNALSTANSVYSADNIALCTGPIDNIIAQLVNCTDSIHLIPVRNYLLNLCNTGQVLNGNYTPAQISAAILTPGSGITSMNDLCNPYLVNYDNLDPNMSNAGGTFSCNTDAFYAGGSTMLNGNSLLALQNIGTTYNESLAATNPFSVALFTALGATTATVSASHDVTRHMWILNYANAAANSHVQIFFRADDGGICATPFAKSNVNETVSVSLECINVNFPGFANGYIGKFAFTTKVNHILSGVTTQCTLPSWNDKFEVNVDQNNPIALAIPMTQMRALYKDLWDTLRSYTVYGADHPYYRTMLRNFLNYKLKKSYSDYQYLNFIQSAALTDSMRVDRYPFYFKKIFNTQAAADAFVAYINAQDPNIVVNPLARFIWSGNPEVDLDLNGIPINKLLTFKNLIANYTAGVTINRVNFLNSNDGGQTYMASLFVLDSDPFIPAATTAILGPHASNFWFVTNSPVSYWNGTAYVTYRSYSLASYDYSNFSLNNSGVDALVKYIGTANTTAALFPAIETTVNNEYTLTDKQAYLHYTYQSQNRPPYKVLDTLQTNFLNANVGAFNGKTLSYGNPERPGAIENLYVLDPATATTGTNYAKATYILNTVRDYFHTTTGKNTIFFTGSNTRVIQGNNVLTAYRCADTAFWYRYFGPGDTLYNVYVRTPRYLDTSDLPNYNLQSISPNPGDGSSYSVKVQLTNPSLPSLNLNLNAFTDFVVAKNEVLHDVLLAHAITEGIAVADTVNNCERQLVDAAIYDGKVKYAMYIDSIRSWLRSDFYAYTMNQGITEHLNVSYRNQRFNYTLYEYDRAGNLAKTIPPAGVAFIANNSLAAVDVQRASNPVGASLYPSYNKPSYYQYNSLNQVINQTTPDGGKTQFFYDAAGRVIFSQNEKQKPVGNMTYTLYDAQGRIMETGEAKIACPYFEPTPYSDSWPCSSFDATNGVYTPYPSVVFNLKNISHQQVVTYVRSLQRDEVVYTNYDAPVVDLSLISGLSAQDNLRKRVATIKYFDYLQPTDTGASDYTYAMHFSYDIEGNVKTLTRDYPLWKSSNQEFKRIDYDYDVISGKVNLLSYNRSFADQFYQRYSYDADNRITKVETSSDGYIWKRDAEYQYYQHGPLARMSLGDLRVQGVDYAYTIQGWLKAVNGDLLDTTKDMGSDAIGNSIHAKDAVALSLDYFKGDYKPIGTKAVTNLRMPDKSMYNGNIPRATTALAPFPDLATTYSYDQLNRIMRADYAGMHRTDTTLTNTNGSYRSSYAYDPDGNLQKLVRNGNKTGAAQGMDSLIYHYTNNNSVTDNKLQNVNDYQANNYTNDIKQNTALGVSRYLYDATGNVIKDLVSGQDTIQWSHYNKVAQTTSDTAGGNMIFGYDGAGNRYIKTISKENGDTTLLKSEYNVRDALGNILAIYNDQSKYVMTQQQWVTYVTNHFTQPCGPVYYIHNILTPFFAQNGYFKNAVLSEAMSNTTWVANQLNISPVSTYLNANPALLNNLLNASQDYGNFYTRLAGYTLANGAQMLGNSLNNQIAVQGSGASSNLLYGLMDRPSPPSNALDLLCSEAPGLTSKVMGNLKLEYSSDCIVNIEQMGDYIDRGNGLTFMNTLIAAGSLNTYSAQYRSFLQTLFSSNTKYGINEFGDSLSAFQLLASVSPALLGTSLSIEGYDVSSDPPLGVYIALADSVTKNSPATLVNFVNSLNLAGMKFYVDDYERYISYLFLFTPLEKADNMQEHVLESFCSNSPEMTNEIMNFFGLTYDGSSCVNNAQNLHNLMSSSPEYIDEFISTVANAFVPYNSDYSIEFSNFVQAIAIDSTILQYQYYTNPTIGGTLIPIFQDALTNFSGSNDRANLTAFYDTWPPASKILLGNIDSLALLSTLYDTDPATFMENYVSAAGNDYHILNTGLTAIPNLTLPSFINKISCCAVYLSPCTYTVVDTILHNALVNALKYQNLSLASHVLYGSSRLGTKDYIPNQIYSSWDYSGPSPIIDTTQLNGRRPWYSLEYNDDIMGLHNTPWLGTDISSFYVQHQIGQKQYELNNHLGNVQATVSDYPVFVGKTGDSIKVHNPALTSAYDYYPFGMLMPDRYVTDTSDHCVTVTQTKWVTHDTTICHDIYDWQWPTFHIYGLATAVLSGGTLTFTAPTLNDAIAVDINVSPNLNHVLSLNLLSADRLTSDSRLIVEQQVNGNWQQLVSTTFIKGLTRVSFLPTSTIVRWRLAGPYLVTVGSACVSESVLSQQAVLVDICNTDGDRYRFGFNGQEKVNEWSGVGNHLDFAFRGYDTRTGKFLGIDPIAIQYPWNSTYAFAENDVIRSIDIEGLEKYIVTINKSWGANKEQIITYNKTFIPKDQRKLGDGVAVKINMFGTSKYFYGENVSDDKAFIKYYEGDGIPGHPLERYNDSRGYATIGYGHLMSDKDKLKYLKTASIKPFSVGSKISEPDASALFNADYLSHKTTALKYLKLQGLTKQQTDAVIDFGYNVKNAPGRIGGFLKEKGGSNFLEYMSGGGGLEKRRIGEAVLYNEGDYIKFDQVKSKETTGNIDQELKLNTGSGSVKVGTEK